MQRHGKSLLLGKIPPQEKMFPTIENKALTRTRAIMGFGPGFKGLIHAEASMLIGFMNLCHLQNKNITP